MKRLWLWIAGKDADLVSRRLATKVGIQKGSDLVSTYAKAAIKALYLPAIDGNYASTADNAALDITGDIDIRALVAFGDWTPVIADQYIATKFLTTGNQRGYMFAVEDASANRGNLRFQWSELGTSATARSAISTAKPAVGDGGLLWVRITMDVDNGASDSIVTFYTSSDGATWAQLGDTVALGATTAIFNSNRALTIGAFDGGALVATGFIQRVMIYAGIDGTLAYDANFGVQAVGATSFTESSVNGLTVTINSTGANPAAIVIYPQD